VLVLSRRPRETIMIGHDIVVTVVSVSGEQVRLGIEAPRHVEVHREEVYRAIKAANEKAAASRVEDTALSGLSALASRRRVAGAGARTGEGRESAALETGGAGGEGDEPGGSAQHGAGRATPR
jgi:carbon storage regulator